MADQKITQLTAHTVLIDTDVLPIVDITAVITKKVTWAVVKSTLKTYFDSLAQNLTNKRIQPRLSSATAGDVSPDLSVANVYIRTNLSGTTLINAPIGTPTHGEVLVFDLTSTSGRTLTWNAIYVYPDGETAPNVTANKWLKVTGQYNATVSKWHCLQAPVYTP